MASHKKKAPTLSSGGFCVSERALWPQPCQSIFCQGASSGFFFHKSQLEAMRATLHPFSRIDEAVIAAVKVWGINLVWVAKQNDFGFLANTGNDRKCLSLCAVLHFINHHILPGDRTATHIGHSLSFDDAPFNQVVQQTSGFKSDRKSVV